MNLTQPVLKIIKTISKGLPEDKRKEFSDAVTVAAVGKDLSNIHWQFLAAELRGLPDHLPRHIQAAIDIVSAGMDRLAAGKAWHNASEAASFAFAASFEGCTTSYSAVHAAAYAARAVDAHDIDITAVYAADAVFEAAKSAESAAFCLGSDGIVEGFKKARQRQRSLLLSIIERASIIKDVQS